MSGYWIRLRGMGSIRKNLIEKNYLYWIIFLSFSKNIFAYIQFIYEYLTLKCKQHFWVRNVLKV